jgi:glycosyltransferase involved in cell wall biosynthesis
MNGARLLPEQMKVLQILPELNSGGVERGTFEIGRHLVRTGHEAVVVSNGGRMVPNLEAAGIRHITMPVHRKRIGSLFKIAPFRKLLMEERPDILHIRSRLPAWIAWLACRKIDPQTRPRLLSTVHGFYSVNAYSAVMVRGERIIAVSESIRSYILKSFPKTADAKIRVIHRGVSPEEFPRGYQPEKAWLETWQRDQPQFANKSVLLLPGRMSRWKGQETFLQLVAELKKRGLAIHGLLAGDTHPRKRAFGDELRALVGQLGISDDVTFLGHRNDLRDVMAVSNIVYSLSTDPEAFGRVSLEAMALGRSVIGFNHGGVGEQLAKIFPAGAVPLSDLPALVETTVRMLREPQFPLPVCPPFTQAAMCAATVDTYTSLLASPR